MTLWWYLWTSAATASLWFLTAALSTRRFGDPRFGGQIMTITALFVTSEKRGFSLEWFVLVNCFLFTLGFRLFDKPLLLKPNFPLPRRACRQLFRWKTKAFSSSCWFSKSGKASGREITSAYWNSFVVCAWLDSILPGTAGAGWTGDTILERTGFGYFCPCQYQLGFQRTCWDWCFFLFFFCTCIHGPNFPFVLWFSRLLVCSVSDSA